MNKDRVKLYELMNKYKETINEIEDKERETDNDNEREDDKTENTNEAIPYTNQDEILSEILDSARQLFGANFSNTKNPLLYYPEDENISLSGEITGKLKNAKFQFWFQGDDGCIISTQMLKLDKDVVELLDDVYGYFENWQKKLAQMADKKPMSMKGEEENKMVPGDDFGSH